MRLGRLSMELPLSDIMRVSIPSQVARRMKAFESKPWVAVIRFTKAMILFDDVVEVF